MKKRQNNPVKNKTAKQNDQDFVATGQVKKKKKVKFNLTAIIAISGVLVALLITYIVLVSLHPVGVSEFFADRYATLGTGEGYNVSIEEGKPQYTVSADGRYFLITDTAVNCYNQSGKTIFSRSHSYSEPVLKFGDTRYILYGQGENEVSLSTMKETLFTNKFDNGIICANISKAGGYAVATKADGYDSSVSVFDKNNKKIYEWFSPDETINNVAVSDNGKYVMISTISVVDGTFVSSFYVLDFKRSDPIFECKYENLAVYQLYAIGNDRCAVVSEGKLEFINYINNETKKFESEYSISMVKMVGNRFVSISSIASNQEESIVEVYSLKGEQLSRFTVNSFVNDFAFKSDKIYILGLSKVMKYDTEGKLLASTPVDYDSMYIENVNDNEIACVKNTTIDKYKLLAVGE